MLYKIEIHNNVNNSMVTFMTHQAWKATHGSTCTSQDKSIAQEYKHYKLMYTNESGFYGLPTNSLVRQQGIRQNGTSFLSNSYEDRQLLFNAKLFKDLMNDIDTVMQQQQYSLSMLIYNEYEESLSIEVDCLGKYENGNFEFKSVGTPLFSTTDEIKEDFTVEIANERKTFFPFKVNDVYFTMGEELNEFSLSANFEVYPTIKIYKSWSNLTLTHLQTGEQLFVNVDCSNYIIIDSENLAIIQDNYNVDDDLYSGTFPTLYAGLNTLKFEFEQSILPIQIEISYNDKRASIL